MYVTWSSLVKNVMLGACQVVDIILQMLQESVIAGYKEK